MAIKFSEVNFEQLVKDLHNCCLGEDVCNVCNKSECIVGYGKKCLVKCFTDQVTYVEGGNENIPVMDFKVYEEEDLAKGIAHTLKMCRSCNNDHYDQCIISVIRNCYEIGIFGETQPYNGSNFSYITDIQERKVRVAEDILAEFTRCGNEG